MRGTILKKNIPSKNCRVFFFSPKTPQRSGIRIRIRLLDGFTSERFLYDLEMKTPEQNRNNERTKIERFDWFIELIQTRMAFGWLREGSGDKNFFGNFLEINQYFALTSYCKTTGQSNNALSILEFSLAGKRRGHVLIFSSVG